MKLAQRTGQLAESTSAGMEAACQEVGEACEIDDSSRCKQLEEAALHEKEQLMKQHEVVMEEAAEMTARRNKDSKQFTYTVRGHTTPALSGSIPHSIFEAEPGSALNAIYNGEWAYAKDDQGRAYINSNPAHWPLILDWLSFGSVPTHPSESFIAECQYWQLHNLLAKWEE